MMLGPRSQWLITRHGPLHALPMRRRRILPIHPTSHPFITPFSPIFPIKSCSPPRFLHRRHGSCNPLSQLRPGLHDGCRGQQVLGSPSCARLPSCGRHYCWTTCSGAPLHPPEAWPVRKVRKDQQCAPEEEDDDESEPPPVPKPEEDDVPPSFVPHDAHAQPPLVPVRIDLGFFIG